MALNENIMVRISADTSNYTAKMKAASKSATEFGDALERPMTAGEKFEAGFVKVGTMVGAVSAAIGVAAVKSFADFDAAMSEVGANVDTTGNQLTMLREAALEAGKSTIYSATESAQAINELGKAGMSVTDILSGGLTGALNLAASDGMEVAQAAEYMSSALAMFHLEGSRATDVADALAAGAGKALGEVSDFGEALNNCGAQAYSFGMSMEETVGTLALFAENGMVGAEAGTQLNSMLMKLASPTKEAQGVMDELGIAAYDAGGNFVGMAEFAGQLQKAEADLTQEQRNQYNATMFGSYAIKGANYLYQAGEQGVRDWTDAVSESGYASEIAAKKTDNLKGDLEQLGGAVETSFIRIGEAGNGILRPIVQTITDVIDAFADLPSGVQQGVLAIGMVVGAAAGLHKVFGHLETSTSTFGRTMGLVVDPIQRVKTASSDVQQGMQMVKAAFMDPQAQIETFGTTIGKTQGIMAGLKTGATGIMDLMGGPWGVAISAGIAVLGSLIQQHQRAKERVDELSESLRSGASAAEYFGKALSKSEGSMYTEGFFNKLKNGFDDVWTAVDRVGIKHSEFVDAITGNQAAYDGIVAKVNDWYGSLNMWDQWWDSSGNVVLGAMSEQQGNYQKALELTEAQESAAQDAARQKTAALLEGKDATSEYAAATGEAADADQILSDQFGATTDGVNELATALSEVISALDTYYGFARSETDALLDLRSGYLDLEESVKKNGATLDTYTEKGIANRQALNDLAKSAVKAAEAQAQNGRTVDEINGTMNEAHDKFVHYAQAMGASAEEAERMAEASGLGKDAAQRLIDAVKTANATPLGSKTAEVLTDEAIAKLNDLMGKTTSLPNGKVIIYGDNSEAMNEIAQVVGAQIDPKTGQIIANKDQYDAMLALCNGATIDPHTGQLIGENSEYWKTLCITNGWKIDPKTGFIYGNNDQAIKAVNAVNNKNIADKWFNVTARGADYAEQQIGRLQQMTIGDKSFTVTTYYTSQGEKVHGGTIPKGNAMGGYISGPGTGTSDSILRRVSNGEYITNARSTAKYRRELEAINGGYFEQFKAAAGYASGGYVQATPAEPYVRRMVEERGRTVYEQTNNFRMYTQGSPRTQADLIAAKIRFRGGTLLGG